MRRFFASADCFCDGTVSFDASESGHISRVLRLQKGDEILVWDGSGTDYVCSLDEVGTRCRAHILRSEQNKRETDCELALFQAVLKNEKMDLAIQKATEIGVKRIVPVFCSRCVVKQEDGKSEAKKRDRREKIAQEACKQCGRSRVPKIENAVMFDEALELLRDYELKLVAYEEETTKGITEAIRPVKRAAYFIGPEGGMTEEEHHALCAAGAQSVTLGKRILRAETAAVVCGAVMLACMGEMNGEMRSDDAGL